MTDQTIDADICIIGAGSGGLSVASGATQLGLKTVLIEKGEMGGDCLNTGCVPSKALLSASKWHPTPTYSDAMKHVHEVIASIAPHDSQERFEGLGVHVIREHGAFIDAHSIRAGHNIIRFKKAVIATGSRASIPPIEGLDKDRVLTNETIFDLKEKPDHLIIIGGGPIGVEMAQAHHHLGSKVTIIEAQKLLQRDDPHNVAILMDQLIASGIHIFENTTIKHVSHNKNDIALTCSVEGHETIIHGTHILVAAGRSPNAGGLDLDKAGITYDAKGIQTDKRLRTNKKHIFAIGDVAGGPQFTHIAGYHAGIVIRNVCFKMPAKVDYKALPWATYTTPELAQVGMTEAQARTQHGDAIQVIEHPLTKNDRATAEGSTTGQLRVIATKKGHVLGASMVGDNAGDLIQIWGLMIGQKLKLSALAGMIAPYLTRGEINKHAAGTFYTHKLFSDKTRWVVRMLGKLPF